MDTLLTAEADDKDNLWAGKSLVGILSAHSTPNIITSSPNIIPTTPNITPSFGKGNYI